MIANIQFFLWGVVVLESFDAGFQYSYRRGGENLLSPPDFRAGKLTL